MTDATPDLSERVLVFAPVGRDAALTTAMLQRAAITCHACASIAELCEALDEGAGAVLITEEALDDRRLPDFIAALEQQPPWSDISTLLFAGNRHADATLATLRTMETIRNVTLLDRPIRMAAVLSAVRASLRSRRRQYEVREILLALHRARNEAEHANRLKDEFLATLSHELRTPLNAILGWTTMLRHGQVAANRYSRVFEVLERNATAQAQLIADVLDVSRIITGKLQLVLQPVELSTILRDAIEAIGPAAIGKGVELHLDVADTATVHGDPQRLQQVFWNLLSNAIKFTPPGGRVVTAVSRTAGGVEVTVTDTGIGIDPAFVPYVFDRFRQADQSTTRAYGGLGLGLAIVRHLAELHGGRVSVRSDGAGQGATFSVALPVPAGRDAAPIARRPPKSAEAPEFALSFEGHTILLVDDDASTRDLLLAVLGGTGATVLAASSSAEAYDLIQRHAPDLLVADLGMPGEDGFTLIKRIRASREPWRNIRAVALSAYADGRSERDAVTAGFTRFLGKPARPQDLLRTIDDLVNSVA